MFINSKDLKNLYCPHFNDKSNRLGLFFVESLVNRVHCMFIFTFFVWLFLKGIFCTRSNRVLFWWKLYFCRSVTEHMLVSCIWLRGLEFGACVVSLHYQYSQFHPIRISTVGQIERPKQMITIINCAETKFDRNTWKIELLMLLIWNYLTVCKQMSSGSFKNNYSFKIRL